MNIGASRYFFIAYFLLLLTGCTFLGGKPIPFAIIQAPDGDLQYSEIANDVNHHKGSKIRWGGEIIKVKKSEQTYIVTVIESPITVSGRPDYEAMDSRKKRGRYIININSEIRIRGLRRNNLLTVAGTIDKSETFSANDSNNAYPIPVITAEEVKTWPSLNKYYDLRHSHEFNHWFYYGGYYGNRWGYDFGRHYGGYNYHWHHAH